MHELSTERCFIVTFSLATNIKYCAILELLTLFFCELIFDH